MTGFTGDWLKDMLSNAQERPGYPANSTRANMALRAECAAKGHKYQVHGKNTPTKVACARCSVSWAIGPRTEPA